MATIIVNPEAQTDGTGSLASPRNVWPSSFSPGDTVLQVAGTRWTGHNGNPLYNIIVSQSGTQAAPIVLGVCAPQTGEQVTDGSQRAFIDGTGRSTGIRVTAQSWVDVIGFDSYATGTDTQPARGIYVGNNDAQPASHCRVINCRMQNIPNSGNGDDNAIQLFGNDCVIRGLVIANMADDGIWFQGNRNIVEHNKISRVGQDSAITGDGIQMFGNATLGVSGNIIRHNDIDHSDKEEKQCIIAQGLSATSDGVLIYGNRLRHYRGGSSAIIALYIEIQNALVFGNYVEGGYYGILTGKTANGDGDRARIFGNVVIGASYGIDQGSTCTGGKIIGNTVVDSLVYGIYADNDTGMVCQNNIVLRGAAGIGLEAGATENYNCIYGMTGNAITSLGGGARTLGANNITVDPLLDDAYRLTAASPCRGAGVYIPGAKHMGGKAMNGAAPDIGAYRYFAERSRGIYARA